MSVSPSTLLFTGALFCSALMAMLFLVQKARRNANLLDVGRALAPGVLGIVYALGIEGYSARRGLVALMAAAWSARLAGALLLSRGVRGPEDGRYARLRRDWGVNADRNFFFWFQLQAGLALGFSVPFLIAAGNPTFGFAFWDIAGLALWVVAMAGESLADRQLAAWRDDPAHKGKTCRTGLWRFSRHPNYFFESLHWCAYVLLAMGSPWWPVSFLGPTLAAFVLTHGTGIPRNEAQALSGRGRDYREYQAATSVFFPWFPRGSFRATVLDWLDRGRIPDALIARGVRRLLRDRLRIEDRGTSADNLDARRTFMAHMRDAAIMPLPDAPEARCPEPPSEFFQKIFGRHLRNSCALWEPDVLTLDEAETEMLRVTCARAGVQDGMEILELGSEWGALSLWIAQQYPRCRLVAVSDSAIRSQYVRAECDARGLTNVVAVTEDLNQFDSERRFDRVLSIEMCERARNWEALLAAIARWLKPEGRCFLQLGVHGRFAWEFESAGEHDWLTRHFLAGRIMPADDLPLWFQADLAIEDQWRINGRHYEKTARAWLRNLQIHRDAVRPALQRTYGPLEAQRWFHRWRTWFLLCAELWGTAGGEEWWVSQYRFRKR